MDQRRKSIEKRLLKEIFSKDKIAQSKKNTSSTTSSLARSWQSPN